MIKRKTVILIITALIFSLSLSCFTVFASEKTTDNEEKTENVALSYKNSETGFAAQVFDDLDLLTDSEEASLLEDMAPITQYGNAAFWSTDEKTGNAVEQARVKRLSLYSYEDAVIFVINMSSRKLTIQSYGRLYEYITDSKARSITDNGSSYAASQQYYKCASKIYSEILSVIEGQFIPEPMKIAGFAVISVMLGITIALCIAFSKKSNPLRAESDEFSKIQTEGTFSKAPEFIFTNSKIVHRESSGSGGGGCGGGGGGGGGCGGGGSSGF